MSVAVGGLLEAGRAQEKGYQLALVFSGLGCLNWVVRDA